MKNIITKNYVSLFLKIIFIFFLIYDIKFISFSWLTTGRFAFGVLALNTILKRKRIEKNLIPFLLTILLLLLCSLFQGGFSGDFTQSSRLFFFFTYSLLSAYFLSLHIKDKIEIFWLFLIVCSVQGMVMILSFFVPVVKETLSSFIEYGGNYDITNQYRAFGLTSNGGAALSVIQSIGVMASIFILKEKNLLAINRFYVFVLSFICFFSAILVGRTGIIISIVSYFYLFSLSFNKQNLIYVILFALIAYLIEIDTLIAKTFGSINDFSVEYFSDWLRSGLAINNNNTTAAIANMYVPPLEFKTIIGTGQILGQNGLNASGNDSGYIQTYYSLGIVLAIIFYGSFLWFTLKFVRVIKDSFLFIVLIMMFIVEYKEPFIFKYALPFFIVSLIFVLKPTKVSRFIRF